MIGKYCELHSRQVVMELPNTKTLSLTLLARIGSSYAQLVLTYAKHMPPGARFHPTRSVTRLPLTQKGRHQHASWIGFVGQKCVSTGSPHNFPFVIINASSCSLFHSHLASRLKSRCRGSKVVARLGINWP